MLKFTKSLRTKILKLKHSNIETNIVETHSDSLNLLSLLGINSRCLRRTHTSTSLISMSAKWTVLTDSIKPYRDITC